MLHFNDERSLRLAYKTTYRGGRPIRGRLKRTLLSGTKLRMCVPGRLWALLLETGTFKCEGQGQWFNLALWN
jgi:hypothetical protein